MKTLGIIGGMGPMATAYLLELIIQMTAAKTDQFHYFEKYKRYFGNKGLRD